MKCAGNILNLAVAAVIGFAALPAVAQTGEPPALPGESVPDMPVPDTDLTTPGEAQVPAARLDQLLADLARPGNSGWRRVERQITTEWSKSGSAAMDLLLVRGRDALREDNPEAALAHLGALTDHAPDFAEGWNARATALFRAGYYGPAASALARVLALNPQHFGALAGMGAILSETGDPAGALRAYRAALAIHPNLERVRTAVARLEKELSGQQI